MFFRCSAIESRSPLVRSAANDDEPRFSFDGNWLAYNSDESGTQQVYLIPLPAIRPEASGVHKWWRAAALEV